MEPTTQPIERSLTGVWMPIISLERINRISKMRYTALQPYLDKYGNRMVLIWSMQHRMFWRPNAGGYVPWADEAGRYTLIDALDKSQHCGPEQRIHYCFIPNP